MGFEPKKGYIHSEFGTWFGTGMAIQKYVPKKQKVRFLKLTCLFLKNKFYETFQDFTIDHPFTSKFGMGTLSFNFSLD